MIDRDTLFRSAVASQPALVYESNTLVALACGKMIRELQLEVDVTGKCDEALRLANGREYCFALIRLDPKDGNSGLYVAAAVRAKCATTHIVLVSTAWPAELLAQTKKLERTVVLEVPSDVAKFQELIQRTVVTWSSKARTGLAHYRTTASPKPTSPVAPPLPAVQAPPPPATTVPTMHLPPRETRSPSPPPPRASAPSNRRRHVRFFVEGARVELEAKRWVALPFAKGNKGRRLLDLSEGGACLICTEQLEVGTRVRLKIVLEKVKDEIEVFGDVRWCRQDKHSSKIFLVGVLFVDLDSEQTRKLKQFEEFFTASAARDAAKKPLNS